MKITADAINKKGGKAGVIQQARHYLFHSHTQTQQNEIRLSLKSR